MASVPRRITASLGQQLLLCSGLVIWVWICAEQLSHQIAHPRILGIVLLALIVLAPILLLKISRVPMYLLATYAAFVPFNDLLVMGSGATLTKMLAMLTGASLVLGMIAKRRVIKPSRGMFVLIALTLYAGATIFWAIDQSQALFSYGIFLNYILLFAAISLYPVTPNDLKLIMGAAIGGAIAAAGYGDYLFVRGQEVFDSRLYIGVNATYSIDPNEYAASMLAPMAIAIMMFLRSRPDLTKLFWFAIVSILFSACLASGSRGGIMALGAMAVFLLFRSRYKKQLFAIICVSCIAAIGSPVSHRLFRTDVSTADGRVDIWKVGIAALHQYWFAGAGIGNFGEAFSQYYLAIPHVFLPWDRVAHSVFMQSAVEYGLIGFLLVMAVWYYMFRDLARVQGDQRIIDICTGLRAAVLALFVAGYSLDLMMYKYTWLAFSLVALMRSMLLVSGVPVDTPKQKVTQQSLTATSALGHGT